MQMCPRPLTKPYLKALLLVIQHSVSFSKGPPTEYLLIWQFYSARPCNNALCQSNFMGSPVYSPLLTITSIMGFRSGL